MNNGYNALIVIVVQNLKFFDRVFDCIFMPVLGLYNEYMNLQFESGHI